MVNEGFKYHNTFALLNVSGGSKVAKNRERSIASIPSGEQTASVMV
jgi:hypothetical protein